MQNDGQWLAASAKPHGVRRYKIYINKAPVASISDRLGADIKQKPLDNPVHTC